MPSSVLVEAGGSLKIDIENKIVFLVVVCCNIPRVIIP